MIFYYVVTAENKCAGNLEAHIWERRVDGGRVAKWRVAEWRILRGKLDEVKWRDGRPEELKATSSRNDDNVEEEVKYGC